MKPVMYLFANQSLGMSPGKLAAQVAHAAVESFRYTDGSKLSEGKSDLLDAWLQGGHYTKLVMEARNTEHLQNIERYINDRGVRTFAIIDEGRTEIPSHSLTAIGCEIVDKDDPHIADTFSSFKTYKEKKPEPETEIVWGPIASRIGRWIVRD